MFLCMLILIYARVAWALVGYDCNGQHLNVTTVSLNSIGDCDITPIRTQSQEVYIQLLQLSEFNYAPVISCKIEISRIVYHCGMHSHISAVHNGLNEYLEDITDQQCKRMHEDGSFSLGHNGYITGLTVNKTTTRTFTMAGTLTNDGRCTGAQFSDPYGTWESVVVQAVAKFSIKSANVPVRMDADKIILKSGTICSFQSGFCLDGENGHTFWSPFPPSSCKFDRYDVLYEGIASKITEEDKQQADSPVYALTTQDITFALSKVGEQHLCGYTLSQTEHPKLFILETTRERTFTQPKKLPVENLDIFTYINSKFVYVERHVKTQMTTLYQNLLKQRCLLEQQVLSNALAVATLKPDEFAYTVMKSPGHMALTAGEVIHIIKCVPIEVRVRHSNECYTELPVWHGNRSAFITPKSHILTTHGTQRECSHILPVMYVINQAWHRISPRPVEVAQPHVLHPMTRTNWRYTAPATLATSGIYTQGDLENLRDHIMFPAEKAAVLNTIVRGATGKDTAQGSISLTSMFDEETMAKLAENAVTRFWDGFITFGSASAGILAIFVLLKFVKAVADTFIHGYQLHAIYGCGFQLIGAVWSSLSHLLIRKGERSRQYAASRDAEAFNQGTSTTASPPKPTLREFRQTVRELEQISSRNLLPKGEGVTSRDPPKRDDP